MKAKSVHSVLLEKSQDPLLRSWPPNNTTRRKSMAGKRSHFRLKIDKINAIKLRERERERGGGEGGGRERE